MRQGRAPAGALAKTLTHPGRDGACMANDARRESHENGPIMQKRDEDRPDPHLHKLKAGEEAGREEMSQRHVPTSDRVAGHARFTRDPYPGEIVGNKEPPFEVVGLDALSPLLTHVEFPATREQVIERIGAARVPVSRQRAKSVREILEQVAPTEFRSSRELEDSVMRVWDQVAEIGGRASRHRQNDNLEGRDPKGPARR